MSLDQEAVSREGRGGFNLVTKVLDSGRRPHVRPSVHGPRKTGRSPIQRYCYAGKKTAAKIKNRCT
ncbi:MAG: hypothetical protein QOE55_4883 [Acidobacteriaceae bacterium]|nr:hypothetical protein [Acidobacteriaceae bacterium]